MGSRWKTAALCALSVALLTACGQTERLQSETPVEHTFTDVSVHDPAVVKGEDGAYYIFGSHLAVAKTEDLMNWEYINEA